MRYRQLSPTGDYTFGSGSLNYLIDTPAAVAQAVETTLRLWLGEWYLDLNAGTPYPEGVLGKHSQAQADQTLLSVIYSVQGVTNVQDYETTIDPNTRTYKTISATLNTIYGVTQLQVQNYGNF